MNEMAPLPFRAARSALQRLGDAIPSVPSTPITVEAPAGVDAYGPEDAVAVLCADDGLVVYASEPWNDLLGYSRGELVGRHVSEVAVQGEEGVPGERLRAISRALRQTGRWRGETSSVRKDGGRLRCCAEITEADDDRHGRVWIIHVIPFDAELPSLRSLPASRARRDADP